MSQMSLDRPTANNLRRLPMQITNIHHAIAKLSIAIALCLSISTVPAFGQASSSSDAVGKVLDTTGASVPGATVHLVNNATGAERIATTNDAGEWSIPTLPPANYRVRVEKQGFKTSEIRSLEVEIGTAAKASVHLRVGGNTEPLE